MDAPSRPGELSPSTKVSSANTLEGTSQLESPDQQKSEKNIHQEGTSLIPKVSPGPTSGTHSSSESQPSSKTSPPVIGKEKALRSLEELQSMSYEQLCGRIKDHQGGYMRFRKLETIHI